MGVRRVVTPTFASARAVRSAVPAASAAGGAAARRPTAAPSAAVKGAL